jgi:hypothetical protein
MGEKKKALVYDFIEEVNEMQKKYPEAVKNGKKGICDLCVPFRDKYGLPDSTVLELARKNVGLNAIIEIGKKVTR